ncbi:MAG: hypothetical protein Ct9H90mP8_2810 [Pseudomonadota bacterium]|nr:MAG: hypothetical protein Ct9H90mP8_2810 [Pseudomonadota bacterium]
MTVLWAKELAQYDIRVAAVAPGFTATEMVMSLRDEVKNKFPKQRAAPEISRALGNFVRGSLPAEK